MSGGSVYGAGMYDDIENQLAFERSLLTQTLADVFVETADMESRLEVYRRNFMQGHCKALRTTFSKTAEYLGEAFDTWSVSYICQHRPKAGQLFATFGDKFPEFLQNPIAAELARLEWELQQVLIAKSDEGGVPLSRDATFWQLRSDVRLFQSAYNIADIYRDTGDAVLKTKHYYIVWRDNSAPVIQSLCYEEYVILNRLRVPCSIDELFAKLTFCQEVFVNVLPKVFNINFIKVADVHTVSDSKMCTSL